MWVSDVNALSKIYDRTEEEIKQEVLETIVHGLARLSTTTTLLCCCYLDSPGSLKTQYTTRSPSCLLEWGEVVLLEGLA